MDVVLQGPWFEYTPEVIRQYRAQPWVDRIICSTWMGEKPTGVNLSVFNADLDNPGVGNRNRQIKTSFEGLKRVKSTYAIKARTDQIITDLPMMKRFWDKFNREQIFTLGMYCFFPFHVRDHFFMGPTDKLLELFDAPYDPYQGPDDYRKCMRAEAWIGSAYYARYIHDVVYMRERPATYLYDLAPRLHEALRLDFQIRDHYFQVFPRINLVWPKAGLPRYLYEVSAQYSEYWYEDKWE